MCIIQGDARESDQPETSILRKTLKRLLHNRRITEIPVRVLRELSQRGDPRLPADLQCELDDGHLLNGKALSFLERRLAGEMLTNHGGQWVINSLFPPFPGPAFERLFENMIAERPHSPICASLAITSQCPCRCWHCSVDGRGAEILNLKTADWLSVISQLHDLGVSVIGFTGGEPLMRTDLPQLISAVKEGGAAPFVSTTGIPLDEEWIKRLQHAGLWGLGVGLDHPEAEAFDRLRRKKGAHQAALKAISMAQDAGFYTVVNTVVTRRLLERDLHLPLYELITTLGADEFRLIEPKPCGRLSNIENIELIELDEELENKVRAFHCEINKLGILPKVCALNQIESPQNLGCSAGTRYLYVDPGGTVSPCDFSLLSFGNVRGESLSIIWERMNTALGGAPRRECLAKCQRKSNRVRLDARPFSPEQSEQLCRKAKGETLPHYFANLPAEDLLDSCRDSASVECLN